MGLERLVIGSLCADGETEALELQALPSLEPSFTSVNIHMHAHTYVEAQLQQHAWAPVLLPSFWSCVPTCRPSPVFLSLCPCALVLCQ